MTPRNVEHIHKSLYLVHVHGRYAVVKSFGYRTLNFQQTNHDPTFQKRIVLAHDPVWRPTTPRMLFVNTNAQFNHFDIVVLVRFGVVIDFINETFQRRCHRSWLIGLRWKGRMFRQKINVQIACHGLVLGAPFHRRVRMGGNTPNPLFQKVVCLCVFVRAGDDAEIGTRNEFFARHQPLFRFLFDVDACRLKRKRIRRHKR